MARVSKYKPLEGQTFNVKGLEVKVIRYHKESRISKSGRKYYSYRLDVQLEGYTDILEISTTSWKKQSFIKRLAKTSVNKKVAVNPVSTIYVDDDDRQKFNYDELASIAVNIIKPEPPVKPVKPVKPKQKAIEDIEFNATDETLFYKMKEFRLQDIDNNNESRQYFLFERDKIDDITDIIKEAEQKGFKSYEDYINWYFDSENEKQVKMYYLLDERHDELVFRYNLQDYFEKVAYVGGYQGLNKTYKKLAKKYHPDKGGNQVQMNLLIEEKERAIENYKKELQDDYNRLKKFFNDEPLESLLKFLMIDEIQFNDMIKFNIIGDDLLMVIPNLKVA